jgi:ATP-dependent helicase HrpB
MTVNGQDDLPITASLPALLAALQDHNTVVLQAPPGAGKTTLVPLALLTAPWLGGFRIIMLEPRRIASRAAANRMAEARGERAGGTVGYRVRNDTRVGPTTRIEVVTDGVFTRMIQHDPALTGIGIVIFDEFHERRIETDLGLALALDAQAALRPDLRLLVMSATLDGAGIAAFLGDAPVITATGRAYPVEIRHGPAPAPGRLADAVAATVMTALADPGDILVFLPGTREIRQVQRALSGEAGLGHVDILPLSGDLDPAAQDRALTAAPPGRRKIILATSIAETSLTIDGVRQVVDSGLVRFARHDPATGLTRLLTGPVTQSAAQQRAGRAGRQGPGICRRLWPEAAHAGLEPYPAPEMVLADLAPLALELASWGSADLRFLTEPPPPAITAAQTLLRRFGALDDRCRITPHGREMAGIGLPPRLAHMVVTARDRGQGRLAAALSAILMEREPFPGSDLSERLEALIAGDRRLRRSDAAARRLVRLIGGRESEIRPQAAASVLALGFPDRVARRRGAAGRYVLAGGPGAVLDATDPLASHEFLVVADLDGKAPDARIFLAAPLPAASVETDLSDLIEQVDLVRYDPDRRAVTARRRRALGAIVLSETPLADPDRQAVRRALGAIVLSETPLADPDRQAVRRALVEALAGGAALPWNDGAEKFRNRVALLRRRDGERWPDLGDLALRQSLDDWLGPALEGRRDLDLGAEFDIAGLLAGLLDHAQRRELDDRAPLAITVPSGRQHPIDYAADPPVLRVRLQELLGSAATPAIDRGRLSLSLHLLSPAGRPIQITDDLARFWSGSYKAVRAELRGRYPRHPWPEDPLAALPTTRAKPRS